MKCLDCEREAVDGGLYCLIHPDLSGPSSLQGLSSLIQAMLLRLDASLMSLHDQPDLWGQLYSARTALDEKQRLLVKSSLREDNIQFQKLTADIQDATEQLNQQIADVTKISSTIRLVSEIASKVDSVLSLV